MDPVAQNENDMFSNISWSHYLIAVCIASALYYFVIAFLFYRDELKAIAAGKIKSPLAPAAENEPTRFPLRGEDSIDALDQKMTQIQGILTAAGTNADKAALLQELKAAVSSYSGLTLPAHEDALNLFICRKAEELCSVRFEIEELEQAWKNNTK